MQCHCLAHVKDAQGRPESLRHVSVQVACGNAMLQSSMHVQVGPGMSRLLQAMSSAGDCDIVVHVGQGSAA